MTNGKINERHLRALALDGEHYAASVIAALYKSRRAREADSVLDCLDAARNAGANVIGRSPRMLRLVADELEGKQPKRLKPIGAKITQAWFAAAEQCGMIGYDGTHTVFDLSKPPPSLCEVKMQFAKLYAAEKKPQHLSVRGWLAELQGHTKQVPPDQSFRKTLALCALEYREDKRGRPRN